MIIYPAIDLKGGKCVRLYQGDMSQATEYNDNPAAQAHEWARAGFSWLHLVDLDGAFKGEAVNGAAVRDIIASVDIPVQLGGGIRSIGHMETWLSAGVSRVILGTAAVEDPDLVRQACTRFPGQIVVGIDARDGFVATQGWAEGSDIKTEALARQFEDCGVAAIIFTDIGRDGTGQGVNIEATLSLATSTSIPVIASGGVGSLADIQAIKDVSAQGIDGVIVGKALYDKTIAPMEALEVCGLR